MDHQTRRTGISFINQPIPFISGQFSGRTVRVELVEIQKADLGRKYARVDRRPLDPPPTVLLRLYYVHGSGTSEESEEEIENYDDIQSLGLLCNVDLFPVPATDAQDQNGEPDASLTSPIVTNQFSTMVEIPALRYPYAPQYSGQSSQPSSSGVVAHQIQQSDYHPSHRSQDPTVYYGTFPITENMKCTNFLVGATFVQSVNVDYSGRKSLMFVFADLAVKTEGTFILRYRVFDIFAKTYGLHDVPIQAECYGGAFKVYSTKEFPGLRASTDLTKQLAKWGVRLNIRETERKRRKISNNPSTPYSTADGENEEGSPLANSKSDIVSD